VPSDTSFPITNLPFGVCSTTKGDASSPLVAQKRCVTILGDTIVDLGVLQDAGVFDRIDGLSAQAFAGPTLNKFASHPREIRMQVRRRLMELFHVDGDDVLRSNEALQTVAFSNAADVTMHMPIDVKAYSSVQQQLPEDENGTLPSLSNLKSASVQVSGGQLLLPQIATKDGAHEACKVVDCEVKIACIIGGASIESGKSDDRIFGYCIVSDWVAQDGAASMHFGSVMSPWIVTSFALKPFMSKRSDASGQENGSTVKKQLEMTFESVGSKGSQQNSAAKSSDFADIHADAVDLISRSVAQKGPSSLQAGEMLACHILHTIPSGNGSSNSLFSGDTVKVDGHVSRIGFGSCDTTLQSVADVESQPEEVLAPAERYCDFKLYGYAASSSTWRVRIALHAKKLSFENIPVDLKAGEHRTPEFLAKNPHGQVPVLEYKDVASDEIKYMSQSVAIIELLDSIYPDKKSLYPHDGRHKVAAREMVEIVNAGIQPLQNRVLVGTLQQLSEGKIDGKEFGHSVITKGLRSLEVLAKAHQQEFLGPYSVGSFAPSIADAYIIPQLNNAVNVYGVDVATEFPTLAKVAKLCAEHPWFLPSHPSKQPDAPPAAGVV